MIFKLACATFLILFGVLYFVGFQSDTQITATVLGQIVDAVAAIVAGVALLVDR